MSNRTPISRRKMLSFSLAAGGLSLLPRAVLGGSSRLSPSDKLNIAFIGIGGYGGAALNNLTSENVVALCDVDWRSSAEIHDGQPAACDVAKKYPQAKRYDDWRILLEENHKAIDAVVVSTADHTHAVAALTAMKMGKHVFCEKPLAHSVHEVRMMMKSARKHHHLATHTGIQGHASEDVRSMVEWIRDGAIGTVQEVQVFQASGRRRPAGSEGGQAVRRPSMYAGIEHVNDAIAVPDTVKWDLWLGPAQFRNYNPMYLPLRWRNWLNFGTGILGDHGPHFVDPILWALDLGFPESIEAETDAEYDPGANHQTFPARSVVRYKFPARGSRGAIPLTWYGGGDGPPIPNGWNGDVEFPNGGGIVLGSKGAIIYGPVYSSPPGSFKQVWLLPEELDKSYTRPEKTLPRIGNHWMEWADAAKAGTQTSANWDYGGLLTQICLLGDIAIRLKGQSLAFDPKAEKFTNSSAANALFETAPRPGWELPV
jgi:predicted dehydrogenase